MVFCQELPAMHKEYTERMDIPAEIIYSWIRNPSEECHSPQKLPFNREGTTRG
jgi:hypothetical protein